METLPSGTVTFLFTDIEGSTKLAQEHPAEMPALLARHHEILHHAIQDQNGYVFQIIGDAFCAAFHSASDALKAASDAQQTLQNESWNPTPIKVRMGIHTGTAQLTDEGLYSGYATLASTQRIMSAGHGGQVLVSGATRELVRDALPNNAELLDLGEKRLKDLLRPEHLYQLNISGLITTFPPLKTLDSYPNNLPVHLTSFIGRENEIAEVKQELNEHRLVTLTGSGGTGKTRLSLQVAADLIEKFDHGVWFVELALITDPELIPQEIFSAIGIQEQPGKDPLETLKEYFQDKMSLIVLDNCEHLISASAQVVNVLLRAAPKVKVLASSREALGVRGEVSYPVPSLKLPNIKNLPTIEGLSQYEAVRLFIDRALLASPHFVVDKDNAPFLAQICHRLDGIPLAIELAAARVKVLSVDQISKRLDDRFRLLTGGARTALPRQQTLRALIDWSYDLLSDNERLLLQRLSVFMGGWTLEAAEEVCSGDGIETYDVLNLLTQLVNKSLVVVMEYSQSGETRYRMLETIRQYAREKLLEAGGSELIRDKHLAYFVKLVEQAEPELVRSNQLFWFNKLDDEMDNLRIAMECALGTNVESGLRIASILYYFWDLHGYLREVGGWLGQLLEQYATPDPLHSLALAVYSYCCFSQGNISDAVRNAELSLQLARTLSDKRSEAISLSFLGGILTLRGNAEKGLPLVEQSLAIYRELGDKVGQATMTNSLSLNHDDWKRALIFVKEGLELNRELGNLRGIAACLGNMSRLTFWNGEFTSPVSWLEEALVIARQLKDQGTEEETLIAYGTLAYWKGDHPQAIAYLNEAVLLSEKLGDRFQNLWAIIHMAYPFLRMGDIQHARRMFEKSIRDTQKAEFTIALVYSIEGLASLHVNQNQSERAARLFAWADRMRDQIGDHRPPVEQNSVDKDLALIHSQVNDVTFDKLWSEGSKLTTEEAIALALEETTS